MALDESVEKKYEILDARDAMALARQERKSSTNSNVDPCSVYNDQIGARYVTVVTEKAAVCIQESSRDNLVIHMIGLEQVQNQYGPIICIGSGCASLAEAHIAQKKDKSQKE